MISTMLAFTPAGVLGSGSADARPYARVAVRPSLLPPFAAAQGTGLPAAGVARRRNATTAGTGFPAALPISKQHDPITQHDGTTPLGIHPPGRPKS